MKIIFIGIAAVGVALSALPAVAEGRYDVEIARANARAGGPVSAYDYEILERWGHLSEIRAPHYRAPRAYKKRHYAHRGYRWRY